MAAGAVEVQTPYVADQSCLANTEVGFWGPDPIVSAGRSLMLKQPRGLVMACFLSGPPVRSAHRVLTPGQATAG
jgi:hypothetical protein